MIDNMTGSDIGYRVLHSKVKTGIQCRAASYPCYPPAPVFPCARGFQLIKSQRNEYGPHHPCEEEKTQGKKMLKIRKSIAGKTKPDKAFGQLLQRKQKRYCA